MKKFIITFIVLVMPFCFVCAEDNTKKEKKYRYYYLEKEYSSEFYPKDVLVEEYPYLTDIFTYDAEVMESFDKIDDCKIVEEIPIITYQEQEKVKYIRINNFKSDRLINLEEIDILKDGKQIKYNVDCPTCSSDFLTRVNNDYYGFEKNYLSGNEDILLILDEEYFPNDLEVLLALGSSDNIKASYTVTINNTSLKNDKYYYYKKEEASNYTIESRVKLKNIDHDERYNSEIKTVENVDSVDNAKVLSKKIKYLYQKKLYQRYRENKVYVDGYYSNIKGLIKDEDNYVIIDKEDVIPTISEYIENEVIVEVIKEKEVPKYQEVVRYLSNVNSDIQKEKEEVKTTKKEDENLQAKNKENYLLKYLSYFILGICLKKKSNFLL